MKDIFKIIIREFQAEDLPYLIEGDVSIPLDSGKIITLVGPEEQVKLIYSISRSGSFLKKGFPEKRSSI